jgi:ABC-type multidrug transport system fused ATPase/permease subunit
MAFDLTISDPLGFIASLKKTTKLFQWVSLLFQMALSAFVSFCSTAGGVLMANKSWPLAIGSGLTSVAVVLSIFFVTSDLTRGMMLVRPEKEAEAELSANVAVTRKNP